MARPLSPPGSALGQAMRVRRGAMTGEEAATEARISKSVFYRVEAGGKFELDTAEKLATWLGWTVEQVVDAARKPPAP